MICEHCQQLMCEIPGCMKTAVYEIWMYRPPMLVKGQVCIEHEESERKLREARPKRT